VVLVFEIWPEKEYCFVLMKRVGSILICLAGGLALSAISRADDALPADNPYGAIVKRNIFGLNPIPPPPAVQTPDGPPPPKITLTGITTLFDKPEALYKVAGVRRDGKPPQDESYIFTEGESEDDVEVMSIDVKKNSVTFSNHGVTQEIELTAGQASSGAAPSQPTFNRPFGRPFLRGGFPGAPGGPAGGPGGFQRPFSNGNYNNNNNNNSYNQSGFNNGYNNNGHYNPSLPSGLTGDDQQALIAAQHAQAEQQGNPMASLFPPTKYDGPAGVKGGAPAAPPGP
jgi:hypothetical protein